MDKHGFLVKNFTRNEQVSGSNPLSGSILILCNQCSLNGKMPMKSKAHINIPYKKIAEFCRKWDIQEFALFGSVLRDDFLPDSDIDVLITLTPETRHGLFSLVHMQNELKEIFGREVDIISRRGIESSRNHLRRKAILDSAEVLHVTG